MAIIHVKKRLTFQMHPPENRPNFSERYRSTVALLLSHFSLSALTPNSIDTSRQQQRHRQSTQLKLKNSTSRINALIIFRNKNKGKNYSPKSYNQINGRIRMFDICLTIMS